MACISMPTAMLVGAGVSGLGGIAQAYFGSQASSQAATVQAQSAKDAEAQVQGMFDTTQKNLQPFIDAGQSGTGQVQNLLGLGANGTAGIMQQLQQMPGYQFALQQGLQATQNGFAAQGLGSSGAAIKGAGQYAEGLASQQYQSLFGNAMSLMQGGVQAGSALGGLASQNAGNLASLTTGAGAAQAAGIVGSANSVLGGINTATSGISNSMLSAAMLQQFQKNGAATTGLQTA